MSGLKVMKYYSCFLIFALPLAAQTLPPDAAGCVDSRLLPKFHGCRIDFCEKKDGDHRDVTIKEDGNGAPLTHSLDGDSRSLMYECATGTSPKSIVEDAASALRAAGFEVPYVFADVEGAVTAHKGDDWVTLDSASRFYTLIETRVTAPDYESMKDAASMAEALEKYGHIPLYALRFVSGRADLAPEAAVALFELGTMLDDNPEWNIRIEGHTDNLGAKDANLALSRRRANVVAAYLASRGIKHARVEIAGMADSQPLVPNDNEANRAKNRRIEIVLLPAANKTGQ
jgi:outer membrane protein OmpA-like peptidoglycan-associated protein